VAKALQQLMENPILKSNSACLGEMLQKVVAGHLGGTSNDVVMMTSGTGDTADPNKTDQSKPEPALPQNQDCTSSTDRYKSFWKQFERPKPSQPVATEPTLTDTLVDSSLAATQAATESLNQHETGGGDQTETNDAKEVIEVTDSVNTAVGEHLEDAQGQPVDSPAVSPPPPQLPDDAKAVEPAQPSPPNCNVPPSKVEAAILVHGGSPKVDIGAEQKPPLMLMKVDTPVLQNTPTPNDVVSALNRKTTIDLVASTPPIDKTLPPCIVNTPATSPGDGESLDGTPIDGDSDVMDECDTEAIRALKNSYMRFYRSIRSSLSCI